MKKLNEIFGMKNESVGNVKIYWISNGHYFNYLVLASSPEEAKQKAIDDSDPKDLENNIEDGVDDLKTYELPDVGYLGDDDRGIANITPSYKEVS